MMYAIIYVIGVAVAVVVWGYLDESGPDEDHSYMIAFTMVWPLIAVCFVIFYVLVGPHLLGKYLFRARRRAKLRALQYEER